MEHWHPKTLLECLDSPVLGYLTAFLAFGMLVWYVLIARKWWESARQSSNGARKAWQWLIVIFIVCAIAGYTSWIIAVFEPMIAAVLRITALSVQNVACPIFMYYASRKTFYAFGREQAIGFRVLEHENSYQTMTDRDLANVMRRALDESSERLAGRLAS